MTVIRVTPSILTAAAQRLREAGQEIISAGNEAHSAASGAPSYDGQFGPKVHSLGSEAKSRAGTIANSLNALAARLDAKAEEFLAADTVSVEAMLSITLPPPPLEITPVLPDYGTTIQATGVYNDTLSYPAFDPLAPLSHSSSVKTPWWVVELAIGLLPFGDGYDIGKEIIRLITSGELDVLVLILALLGLLADLGHLDGPVPDPVDGANAGLALLKGVAKQIPPGPARDAIIDIMTALVKNVDEAPRFFNAVFLVLKQDDVLAALVKNEDTLAALLKAGPDVMEALAKNQDVALRLAKNNDALAALIKGGPEAFEQLFKYGDDVALKYLDEMTEAGIAQIDVLQGLDVSRLANKYGIDIHVAGRIADNPADIAMREFAAKEVDDLVEAGWSVKEAQLAVAQKYDIEFFQARLSSGKPEVDIFIPEDQWKALTPTQQQELRASFSEIFDVKMKDVDFYQELSPLDLGKEGIPEGFYDVPDPRTHVPEGSVHFGSDGSIEHPPLGNQEMMEDLANELLDIWGDVEVELP